ncbi:MAG: hypothetical protein SGPRY_004983, partial [Prymnesium sp.]
MLLSRTTVPLRWAHKPPSHLPLPLVRSLPSSHLVRPPSARSATPLMAAAAVQPGFFSLFVAFIMGGLFFSTAVATFGAIYAVGISNVRRFFAILRYITVRVWSVCVAGLIAAQATFKKDSRSRWANAWKVLKDSFGEARRAAADGVEAIKLEANLYFAVIGPPGLVLLQYILDKLTMVGFVGQLEDALRDAVSDARHDALRSIALKRFEVGEVSPRLRTARIYDIGPRSIAFDVDCCWESNMEADFMVVTKLGARVPVKLRNIKFVGPIRVVVEPLLETAPGFGAVL